MAFDLCTVRTAKHPYLIESVQIRIWTIEELCFFLHRNLCLIDESIVNERLADWVSEELGLRQLGHRLRDALQRPDHDVTYFIMPIFAQTGYLQQDELRRVRKKLMEAQVRPEEENAKMKADYLLSCGKNAAACTIYRRILDGGTAGKLRTGFLEAVWNNLGSAYAQAFRVREAAECFLSGERLGHSRELMRKYNSVLPFFMTQEAYQEQLRKLEVDAVWAGEVQKMNAKLALDAMERVRARTREDEDPAGAAEALFAAYRRAQACVSHSFVL